MTLQLSYYTLKRIHSLGKSNQLGKLLFFKSTDFDTRKNGSGIRTGI
jgi:hypothetical protein